MASHHSELKNEIRSIFFTVTKSELENHSENFSTTPGPLKMNALQMLYSERPNLYFNVNPDAVGI